VAEHLNLKKPETKPKRRTRVFGMALGELFHAGYD